ncbi:MAG: tetratricopeptide repeat protein, partial [Deltaproteobacteria bacterium]|nr:tetratricopeptide repeat protein [Deltaproteobacteria bacterium]
MIINSLAIIFIFATLSCTDPEVAKKEHFNSGLAHLEKNEMSAAIIEFKNAIQIDPTYADAYFQLGKAYIKGEKAEAAITAFEKAVELKPAFEEESAILLARAYAMKGEFDTALDKLDAVLKEEADNALLHDTLGAIYLGKQDTVKSRVHLEKALEFDPMLVSAHINIDWYRLLYLLVELVLEQAKPLLPVPLHLL